MAGLPPALVRPQLRAFSRWAFSPRVPWRESRKRVELGLRFPGPPRGTRVEHVELGGVSCEVLRPSRPHDDERALIYLHGGGYTVGSARLYRPLAARLGAALGWRVIVPDYRLGPEHPYPAALEDALAAWTTVTDGEGADPARVVLAGDSAGGGLGVALALALRDAGRPGPAALGLVCPWLDLTPDAAAGRAPAPREPVLTDGLLRRFARAYLAGGADARDPLVSPLRADPRGLPPLVVQTGEDDLIRADGLRFAQRARTAGVPVIDEELEGLWHVPHLNAPLLSGTGGRVIERLAQRLLHASGRPEPRPPR